MATAHILEADTDISTLPLASGDTIELDGHHIIIDTNALSTPVILTNNSATAHMELKDGGGIGLNASLPASICPWVDPKNPLPESNFAAGLTANASAEIRLTGNFGLGGGPASLPTATREGNFWAIVVSSPANNKLTFDRDIPLHSGDWMQHLTAYGSLGRYTVTEYNPITRTATFSSSLSNRSAGNLYGLVAGGVLINAPQSSTTVLTANVENAGTLCVIGNSNSSYGTSSPMFFADRFIASMTGSNTSSGGAGAFASPNSTSGIVRQLVAPRAFAGTGSSQEVVRIAIRSCCCCIFSERKFFVETPTVFDNSANVYGDWSIPFYDCQRRLIFSNSVLLSQISLPTNGYIRLVDSLYGGVSIQDTQIEHSGTVSRVARTDFPVDTDLPDAFYFVPATASDAPWRYEDYWVRKGETLRLSVRAMRGGDNGVARVAICEMGVWAPLEGTPVLADWTLNSGEPLVWRGGQLAWTNDTGEDRQVRVWSMGSGINGAYIRVWRATGGAM